MPKNRRECESKYSGLYTRFYHCEENRFTCFYCGGGATCFDHQPPITRVSDYRSLDLAREAYIKVPACEECNRLASDTLTECLIDRERLIKRLMARKYGKILNAELWDEDSLNEAEIGGRLRQFIQGTSSQLRNVLERLDYAAGVQAWVDKSDY